MVGWASLATRWGTLSLGFRAPQSPLSRETGPAGFQGLRHPASRVYGALRGSCEQVIKG